jgi:hypothetical protein
VNIIDKEVSQKTDIIWNAGTAIMFVRNQADKTKDIIQNYVKTSAYFTNTKHIQKTPMQIFFYVKRKSAA